MCVLIFTSRTYRTRRPWFHFSSAGHEVHLEASKAKSYYTYFSFKIPTTHFSFLFCLVPDLPRGEHIYLLPIFFSLLTSCTSLSPLISKTPHPLSILKTYAIPSSITHHYTLRCNQGLRQNMILSIKVSTFPITHEESQDFFRKCDGKENFLYIGRQQEPQ